MWQDEGGACAFNVLAQAATASRGQYARTGKPRTRRHGQQMDVRPLSYAHLGAPEQSESVPERGLPYVQDRREARQGHVRVHRLRANRRPRRHERHAAAVSEVRRYNLSQGVVTENVSVVVSSAAD